LDASIKQATHDAYQRLCNSPATGGELPSGVFSQAKATIEELMVKLKFTFKNFILFSNYIFVVLGEGLVPALSEE
jgi:hypothetical protein